MYKKIKIELVHKLSPILKHEFCKQKGSFKQPDGSEADAQHPRLYHREAQGDCPVQGFPLRIGGDLFSK